MAERDFAVLPGWHQAPSIEPPVLADLVNIQQVLAVFIMTFPALFAKSTLAFFDVPFPIVMCSDRERMCAPGMMYDNVVMPMAVADFYQTLRLQDSNIRYRIVGIQRVINDTNAVTHANVLIIDVQQRVVEWFEPYGTYLDEQYVLEELHYLFAGFTIVPATLLCPQGLGPQAHLAAHVGDGYCVLFTAWFLVYRLLYSWLTAPMILRRMMVGTPQDMWRFMLKFYGFIQYLFYNNKEAFVDNKMVQYCALHPLMDLDVNYNINRTY